MRLLLFAIVALLLTSACSSVELKTNDWSKYDGPGAPYFQAEEVQFPEVDDPLEPMNRKLWGINNFFMMAFGRPIGCVYRALVPQFFRKGTYNFFRNLAYPVRLVNNLLQGNGDDAWTETKRFGVNTTAGVLGFWDRATPMGIKEKDEDMGQTWGKWGWEDSTYLVIPGLGPSTVRDGLATPVDWIYLPATYMFPATWIQAANVLSDAVVPYEQLVTSNFDAYELSRLLFVYYRQLRIADQSYETDSEITGETDTLGSVFFTFQDPDFPQKGKTRTVVSPATGKELPYTLWLQPEPAPLIYYLPGTGAHRSAASSVAMAEVGYERGNSVVVVSNSFNHEFIEFGLSADVPGYQPSDSNDVYLALDAIDRQLEQDFPGHATEKNLVGLSLGGMHALYIAAAEDPEDDLIDFDIFLTLNAPVSLEHAVKQLDAFYNAPLEYPADERDVRITGILKKVLDLAQGTLKPTNGELPFTETEAKYLIGLAFRNSLRDVIYQTQERNDLGVLKTERRKNDRHVAYREILQFSFMEYMYAFALRYYAQTREEFSFDEESARRMLADCDLHSIADGLAKNGKIRYVTNANDFLLEPGDLAWLQELLGEDRVLAFERGGHVGNLHLETIRTAIRRFARRTSGS